MENQVKVGIGLYLLNEKGQVLLGLRKGSHAAGTWCAPGGHLEFGESFEAASVRECFEETGITINPSDVIVKGVTNDILVDENKHYVTIGLLTHVQNVQPKIMEPNKCEGWQWYDLDKLPQNLSLFTSNFLKTYGFDCI